MDDDPGAVTHRTVGHPVDDLGDQCAGRFLGEVMPQDQHRGGGCGGVADGDGGDVPVGSVLDGLDLVGVDPARPGRQVDAEVPAVQAARGLQGVDGLTGGGGGVHPGVVAEDADGADRGSLGEDVAG